MPPQGAVLLIMVSLPLACRWFDVFLVLIVIVYCFFFLLSVLLMNKDVYILTCDWDVIHSAVYSDLKLKLRLLHDRVYSGFIYIQRMALVVGSFDDQWGWSLTTCNRDWHAVTWTKLCETNFSHPYSFRILLVVLMLLLLRVQKHHHQFSTTCLQSWDKNYC